MPIWKLSAKIRSPRALARQRKPAAQRMSAEPKDGALQSKEREIFMKPSLPDRDVEGQASHQIGGGTVQVIPSAVEGSRCATFR